MERHLTIGVVLFLIAELFLIIWAAVILLVLRDKVLGNRFPKPVWDEEEVVAKQAPLPRWKLWLLAPLGVILLPGVLVIVFVIAAPLVAAQVGLHFFSWLRYRATGKPIPPLAPDPVDFEDLPQDAADRC